ncbi:glycoside hydrolase family 43 protein [Flavobacterium sp. MC2016-06]|jgi:xylan 1,4-beta-xylosidase|uniref:glycoside hydrolase family 43 protein n=1 Tax=Flavobacterium sp. MC2016-06 TaxID=2676308 RepID=UPI0012BB0E7F|nr:glycoside hydrolase family 43 protein [Flavobacterium sp. MC2016-06]MBU3861300.1 glycoside hydrolase family 43 protein [Flavobacterium sp. MC2016-06]
MFETAKINLKSALIVLIIATLPCKIISQKKQPIAKSNYASFDWFDYKGKDDAYVNVSKSDSEYYNPILAGFYPDPSICRVGDKFYLVNSSFCYFPGLPISESTDLVNWKQIGNAITRPEQGDFNNSSLSRGMFAPTIRYHKGIFYVICTNVSGVGNFIVTAKNPAGPWSNPIALPNVKGIDPDLFFDEDGKAYITHNGPPPNNVSVHDGHRAIYMFEYDVANKKTVGEAKLVINGGTDMAIKPVWIEGPHVIKKAGYYYLICAQGGTGFNHSEVVFRSKNIFGPYESYANNPIMTQKNLDPNRKNEVSTTGHADFVELPNGDWWTVFLGCRPYGMDLYNTGRETFMMPVEWKNNWPEIVGGNQPIPMINKRPNLPLSKEKTEPLSGNFTSHDDFTSDKLDLKWSFIRTPLEKWYDLKGGKLAIKARKESIHTETNFSFIGRRQQHLKFEASTKLEFTTTDTLQAAGLVAFQNEKHFLLIGKRLNANNKQEVFLEKAAIKNDNGKSEIIAKSEINSKAKELYLKIEGRARFYDFYYKTSSKGEWILLAKDIDGVILSTKEAGGFVGTYLAMYASSNHF